MTPEEKKQYNSSDNNALIERINICSEEIIDNIKYMKQTFDLKKSSDEIVKCAKIISELSEILFSRMNKRGAK